MLVRISPVLLASVLFLAASAPVLASAQAASEPVRIRGTIVRVDAKTLVVQDRGGEVVSLFRPTDMTVSEVYPIKLSDIRQGSFIGTAAMPQADGTQKALEVVVFPEAARGTGEGHRPWDLLPQSTMTNATVADLAAAPKSVRGGQQLRLTYKGGEQTVVVPPDVPVVTFRPGTESLLVPGVKVLVNAQEKNGIPTALRVTAGRNGFAPPM
ncbi:hypothetical protein QFZ42_000083 [Variovorax paradoxus]|uniref:hypothetical protein n=1 Tax=Variovorax paradoxus TaxID=34073 RepID=UPI00278CDB16|nr:hypothetical protein [Variovorax paradoxus]MDQ0568249.1 hypothetical protein [Variovorax paradoxus]